MYESQLDHKYEIHESKISCRSLDLYFLGKKARKARGGQDGPPPCIRMVLHSNNSPPSKNSGLADKNSYLIPFPVKSLPSPSQLSNKA